MYTYTRYSKPGREEQGAMIKVLRSLIVPAELLQQKRVVGEGSDVLRLAGKRAFIQQLGAAAVAIGAL